MKKPKVIVICGPTATGKSDLAVSIAKHLQKAEVISTDSRQIYRYLDLGTGKITRDEMQSIPHHMLDLITPFNTYTVDRFRREAGQILTDICNRSNTPILCGGTGLYIEALIHDLNFPDVSINQTLRDELETKTVDELTSQFHELNKDKPHNVDLKNKRKIIRAIEVIQELGAIPPLEKKDIYDVLYIGLNGSDTVLQEKIKNRIDTRIEKGMIQESEDLLRQGALTHERMQTLGLEYKFISDLLQKKINLEEFKRRLFFAIWHYAKRQRTWFKRNKDIHWFDIQDTDLLEKTKSLITQFLK